MFFLFTGNNLAHEARLRKCFVRVVINISWMKGGKAFFCPRIIPQEPFGPRINTHKGQRQKTIFLAAEGAKII